MVSSSTADKSRSSAAHHALTSAAAVRLCANVTAACANPTRTAAHLVLQLAGPPRLRNSAGRARPAAARHHPGQTTGQRRRTAANSTRKFGACALPLRSSSVVERSLLRLSGGEHGCLLRARVRVCAQQCNKSYAVSKAQGEQLQRSKHCPARRAARHAAPHAPPRLSDVSAARSRRS
jgi:hypothetical protein